MYKKTMLSNGVRIVTNCMPRMQSVAVGIWIRAGGRYETSEEKGISHYLEHLLFKGSKKYSCRKIKESIEGVGGSLNGFTSEELTCYLAKLPSRHLTLALDILSDMVLHPSLPEEEVEKERTVILEELKMYKDLPQSYVHELLDELLWPKQPLGESVIGTVESVSRISRKTLFTYQQEHYTPPHLVVCAAGRLEHEKLVRRVGKLFSPLKGGTKLTFAEAKEEQGRPQLRILSKDTEQTHLALGFHSLKRDDPLRYALGLLHIILGANMSSRLFNEVREKRGLAYEIGTHVKRFEDTGAFIVHAGMDNEKLAEAVKVILEELNKPKDEMVSADEFKRAKEYYLGQLSLALEDTLDYMLWMGESVTALDKLHTLQEVMKDVGRVTRQDIREVARRIFKEENLNVALIGPLKEKESQLQGLLRV